MRRIRLTVAYDGTNYHGWQVQPGVVTIESGLNEALTELFGEEIAVIGASRTDSGVHARGNVAVFDTEGRMAADRILANLGNDYEVMMESANIETVIRLVASGLGISLIPSIFARTYKTGDKIKYYRIEERYHPVWQWAVIYADSIENLTRPSKELYRILCEKGCQLPNYIE